MTTILLIIGIIAAVIAGLFVLTFLVYLLNLDMKLMAALSGLFDKHYDKVRRDKHL